GQDRRRRIEMSNAKKGRAKKPAATGPAAGKPARKVAAQKVAARKVAVTKVVAKKVAAKKVAAKKVSAKKSPAKVAAKRAATAGSRPSPPSTVTGVPAEAAGQASAHPPVADADRELAFMIDSAWARRSMLTPEEVEGS